MLVQPNVADPEDLKKYVLEMPHDYDLQRRTARIRGDVIVKFEAPPQTAIEWLTVGACFNTYQNQAAERTDNRIAYAIDSPTSFQEVYRANVPRWVNHWRYQWDEDIRLQRSAKVVFVKYTGRPGVNVLRATLHVRPERPPKTAVQITQGYRLGDRQIERMIDMQNPGEYTVDVQGDPENEFIRMAVPSQDKQAVGDRGREARSVLAQ
jgi:hypothetical protein